MRTGISKLISRCALFKYLFAFFQDGYTGQLCDTRTPSAYPDSNNRPPPEQCQKEEFYSEESTGCVSCFCSGIPLFNGQPTPCTSSSLYRDQVTTTRCEPVWYCLCLFMLIRSQPGQFISGHPVLLLSFISCFAVVQQQIHSIMTGSHKIIWTGS